MLVALAALPLRSNASPSLDQLNTELSQVQGRAQALRASVASLSGLISSLGGQIALVEAREAAVRAELARDRAQLAATRVALARERRLLVVLRTRLAFARNLLARQLVSSYEGDKPDLVSVVLEAHGFSDLLEQINFLGRAEQQQQTLIVVTRIAQARAAAAARRLAILEATERRITQAAVLQVRALAGMNELLQSRQAALQQASAAKQAALAATQAQGQQLQGAIAQVQAQQAAAEQAAEAMSAPPVSGPSGASSDGAGAQGSSGSSAPVNVGPALGASGGWVIPGSIVICESGGQNLTPNSAGASGYYQIIPSTWQEYGGTGSAAYQASKAEQDAVATRIWNGSGPHAWDCASMVGIH